MPPKTSKSSTKTEKRNQAKVIEDKTFGLKNKNKSTTVKKFISTVTKTVQNRDKELAAASEAKRIANAARDEKKAQDTALNQLFSNALVVPVKKKVFLVGSDGSEEAPVDETNVLDPILAALASNSTKEDMDLLEGAEYNVVEFTHEPLNSRHQIASQAIDGQSDIIYEDDDTYEVIKVKTLEDLIEEQRLKFQEEGKTGTPITAANLADYNRRKMEAKRIENEAKLKTELSKRSGGKGLSILTGKELFDLSAARFEDDENAMNDNDVVENRKLKEAEEEQLQSSQADRNRNAGLHVNDGTEDLNFQESGTSTLGGVEINEDLFDDNDDDDNNDCPVEEIEEIDDDQIIEQDNDDDNDER